MKRLLIPFLALVLMGCGKTYSRPSLIVIGLGHIRLSVEFKCRCQGCH